MNIPFLLNIAAPIAIGAGSAGESVSLTEAAEPQGEKLLSLMDLAQDGGVVMIIIAVLLVIALYIFIERFLAIKRASTEDENFMGSVKTAILASKIDEARALCEQQSGPIVRMIEKGVNRIGKPLRDIAIAIENVGKLEINKMESNLATLATIAGAAPMLGFLGTVIGMIKAFHQMAIGGNQVEIAALSEGIMQAMVTTVAGLVVGIIAFIGYNMLVAKVEKVIHNMEAKTMEFMDLLEEPAKS